MVSTRAYVWFLRILDLRKQTSGAAQPQLLWAGFELLDQDPFWIPTTQEELEDLGDTADKENIAKKLMESVRKRKGLFVEQKQIVAEKQVSFIESAERCADDR